MIPMPLFHIFNVVFIATQQHALLLAIVSPAYLCARTGFRGWTTLDLYAGVGFIALLILETIADEQQWVFQNKKYDVRNGKIKLGKNDPDAEDIARGFLTRQLYRYSRHANFLAEQSMWWAVYLFSVAATSTDGKIEWVNWTAAGALNLTLLFQVRWRETVAVILPVF
jgi:steroid 5-alpha reductase family enzyme